MKEQTLEFNIGYAFAALDRAFIKCVDEKLDFDFGKVLIPKVWFGYKYWSALEEDILNHIKRDIYTRLYGIFEDIAPKWEVGLKIDQYKQYIRINYTFAKKEEPKKMTVNEIEKALGYKVEIVSE